MIIVYKMCTIVCKGIEKREDMMYLEGKELKTTDKGKRRAINIGKKDTEHIQDGMVVIIPQDDFNKYKEELNQLREIDSTDYTGEILELKEEISILQEEKSSLLSENEKLKSDIENLTYKLEIAESKEELDDLKASHNDRVSDLKEVIAKMEKEAQGNMDTIDTLRQQKENELNSLRKEKDDEIDSLRNDKNNEIANLREKVNKVEKDKGNLETTFGMLLKDYKNLSDKTLVKLFYRKNDDIEHYEEFLNSKSLQIKDTYALPMEKEE